MPSFLSSAISGLPLGARQAVGGVVEVGLVLVEDARDERAGRCASGHLLDAPITGVGRALDEARASSRSMAVVMLPL